MAETKTLDIADGAIHVEHLGGRLWRIVIRHAGRICQEELNSPPCANHADRAMSATVSFLSAFCEAREYGSPDSDNWDLFPGWLYSAELSSAVEDVAYLIEC